MAGIDDLKGYAIAVGALAVVDLVTIAIVLGFGTTGLFGTIANTTHCANVSFSGTPDCQMFSVGANFVTGLTIFATFIGVIILALIGKIIVGLYKE